jgi:hypothetical protein
VVDHMLVAKRRVFKTLTKHRLFFFQVKVQFEPFNLLHSICVNYN